MTGKEHEGRLATTTVETSHNPSGELVKFLAEAIDGANSIVDAVQEENGRQDELTRGLVTMAFALVADYAVRDPMAHVHEPIDSLHPDRDLPPHKILMGFLMGSEMDLRQPSGKMPQPHYEVFALFEYLRRVNRNFVEAEQLLALREALAEHYVASPDFADLTLPDPFVLPLQKIAEVLEDESAKRYPGISRPLQQAHGQVTQTIDFHYRRRFHPNQ